MTPECKQTFPSLLQLTALREVGTQGTTSAAARTLFRSQPAITQAIAAMEKRFDVALFVRTARGMTLTTAGQTALRRVERALAFLTEGIAGRSAGGPANPHAISGSQLLALAAVVQTGGFGAGARLVGLSRASLHRSCRALEETLGMPLFETTSHGLEPTREAEALARKVELASAELRQAAAEIAALSGRRNARIVVAALPLARTSLVPEAVLRFAARHPKYTVTILDGPYESMLKALRHGSADLLVGALREPAPSNDIVQEHLFDDPLAIVVRVGHPLLASRGTNALHLRAFPWVAPRLGTPLRIQFEQLFAGIDLPNGVVECNSLSAARALLRVSDYVMLLSAHQVQPDLLAGTLKLLPHPGGSVLRRIGITTRVGWHPTTIQEEFLSLVRDAATSARAQASAGT